MATPVQTDGLSKWQVNLASYLRVISPISGLFTGSEIQMDPTALSVKVPDIKVDDYIVDTEVGRIGPSHYEGSEFVTEWKNGIPPIVWREYTLSRRRAFGYTVFDDQLKKSPIKNIVQEYVGRKMQTTVLRDHDKYLLLIACLGRMTGKLVAKAPTDATIVHADAYQIACTGDQRDYTWIAEPGENYDNQIVPSFASITGMFLDETDPFTTIDALTLLFSDNWWDTNFGNSERFLLVTPALQLVLLDALISKGDNTEMAFQAYKDADISGLKPLGFLGTLRGGWKVQVIHPEFLPIVYTVGHATPDSDPLTIDPLASSATKIARKVVALAAYKNAFQTYEYFSNQLSEPGGTRFKGTEYVQEFAYDGWVIDQYSEGIIPLFTKGTAITSVDEEDSFAYSGTLYDPVYESFNRVAGLVAAARGWEAGDAWQTYPYQGVSVGNSRPEWFTSPYLTSTQIEAGDYDGDPNGFGDMSHRSPLGPGDETTSAAQAATIAALQALVADLTDRIETLEA